MATFLLAAMETLSPSASMQASLSADLTLNSVIATDSLPADCTAEMVGLPVARASVKTSATVSSDPQGQTIICSAISAATEAMNPLTSMMTASASEADVASQIAVNASAEYITLITAEPTEAALESSAMGSISSSDNEEDEYPSMQTSISSGQDDFQIVSFADAMDTEDWLLLPDDPKMISASETNGLYFPEAFEMSFQNDSSNRSIEEMEIFNVHADENPEALESLKSSGAFEINCFDAEHDEKDTDEPLITNSEILSSLGALFNSIEASQYPEAINTDNSNSECSDVGFQKLFEVCESEELDWEEDHFHDCEDFDSEWSGSYSSQSDNEPQLPLNETTSIFEESLNILFDPEETYLDNDADSRQMQDVVEQLKPVHSTSVPAGYPVDDLPILEGNFFQLADTPPYNTNCTAENCAANRGSAAFPLEIPGKYSEEIFAENIDSDPVISFISGLEHNTCGIMFGDFDSSLQLSTPRILELSDSPYPSLPSSSCSTTTETQKSLSLSSLPFPDSSCSSSSNFSAVSGLSQISPSIENNPVATDQPDSLEEENCFSLSEDNEFEASFDCFPARLQSARKVDYRGFGTKRTRRLRKSSLSHARNRTRKI